MDFLAYCILRDVRDRLRIAPFAQHLPQLDPADREWFGAAADGRQRVSAAARSRLLSRITQHGHEAEIHVLLVVAMKERLAGIVRQ